MWLGIGSGRHLAGSRCQRVETERLRRSELQPGLPGQSRIGDAEERKQRRARGGRAENRAAARNLVHWHDHPVRDSRCTADATEGRSEEHTSELQPLMRSSYAVFCLKNNMRTSTLNTTE